MFHNSFNQSIKNYKQFLTIILSQLRINENTYVALKVIYNIIIIRKNKQ